MRRSNFWVSACQWMTCPCWVLSRSLFFLCGSCSSLVAKITPSDPCYAIPTQVVTMSLIGILQCRNGKSRLERSAVANISHDPGQQSLCYIRSFNVAYSVVTRCEPPPEHEYKKHERDFEQTRTYIRSRFLLLVSCCSFRLRFLP